jgi:hypothetical protein
MRGAFVKFLGKVMHITNNIVEPYSIGKVLAIPYQG